MVASSRWFTLVALGFIGAASPAVAAPVPPGTPAIAIVPAQAPIVIQVHGAERVKNRLQALVKAALPDLGGQIAEKIDEGFKEGLEGRTLKGLESDGPIFIAFLELPSPDTQVPVMAIIARTSNYTEFRNGVLSEDERKALKKQSNGVEETEIKGQPAYFLDRSGWAFVSPSKDAIELLTKEYKGLDTKLAKNLTKSLLDSDVSLYVNLSDVNKQYAAQIREAKDTLFNLFDQLGGQNPATMDMIKKMYGGIFQVVEDGRAVVAAFDFRPEGLGIHASASIGAGTPTNNFLKELKPAALNQIGTLPTGQVTYTATEFGPSLLKAMAPLMYGSAGEEGAKAKMKAAVDELIAAGNTTSLSAATFPASSIQVGFFEHPDKALEAQLNLFKAMGEGATFQNSSIKGKPEVKEKAKTYHGITFHYVKIVWDLDKLTEAIPGGGGEDMKKALMRLLGPGLEIWFGSEGQRVITLSGQGWDAAQAKLDAYLDGKSTIGGLPAFSSTRKQLPGDATMLFIVDAGKFAFAMGDYMLGIAKAFPVPFNLPDKMKPVETVPTFFGGAVVMQPEYGGFDFFLPVTAVHEIRKVLMPLFMGGQ